MDERLNNGPEKDEHGPQRWDGAKNIENDSGDDIKYHPHPAEDD